MIIIVKYPVDKSVSKLDNTKNNNTESLYEKYFGKVDNRYSNLDKKSLESMINENLKKAYSCKNDKTNNDEKLYNLYVPRDDLGVNKEKEETIEDLKAKTDVYPDPKKCKTLYARTKKGYKSRVYEVMNIYGMKVLVPVHYTMEGERL